jgi:AraC-like DNA-binding protein
MNTTSFKYFISVIEYLKKSGIEEKKINQFLLVTMGTDLNRIESDIRIDYDLYESILDLGAELCQTPLFGFHLGKSIKSADFGALGYLVETSENLKQAIQSLMQFDTLVADIGQTQLLTSAKQSTITWQPFKNKNRQVILRNITAWVATVRLLIEEDLKPLSVGFSFHLNESELRELTCWFSCPVHALMESNSIVFPNEYFDLVLTSKNKQIFNELLRMSELQLIELSRMKPIKIQVTKLLNHKPSLENISLQHVASSLNMSIRNIQKKLNLENTSYSQLLDQERKNRILYLLNKVPLGQIATQLGFAEQASLNKAFKRWFNCSPRKFIQ